MTTIVIHGPPGSCKTATAVWEYGVPALKAGRTVLTNIRGFTVEQVKKVFPDLPETAKTINLPLTPEGYEQAARFFHDAPLGCLILLDEVQKIYPSSVRNPAIYDRPEPRQLPETAQGETIQSVQHAFDQHRHLNWDIICTCPNISQVAGFIRDVVEVAYRQRPMSGVLPFMTNRIKRVKHQAVSNGFVTTYILGSETLKINPKAFECYQSTATGVIKSSEDKFSITSQPKLLFTLAFILIALLALGYTSATKQPDTLPPENIYKNGSPVSFKATDKISGTSSNAFNNKLDDPLSGYVNNLINRLKHYAGFVTVNNFRIYYFEGDDIKATSTDLHALNVTIKPISSEFIQLTYKETSWILTTPHYGDREPIKHEKAIKLQPLGGLGSEL